MVADDDWAGMAPRFKTRATREYFWLQQRPRHGDNRRRARTDNASDFSIPHT